MAQAAVLIIQTVSISARTSLDDTIPPQVIPMQVIGKTISTKKSMHQSSQGRKSYHHACLYLVKERTLVSNPKTDLGLSQALCGRVPYSTDNREAAFEIPSSHTYEA
jgi:hypothetical protein